MAAVEQATRKHHQGGSSIRPTLAKSRFVGQVKYNSGKKQGRDELSFACSSVTRSNTQTDTLANEGILARLTHESTNTLSNEGILARLTQERPIPVRRTQDEVNKLVKAQYEKVKVNYEKTPHFQPSPEVLTTLRQNSARLNSNLVLNFFQTEVDKYAEHHKKIMNRMCLATHDTTYIVFTKEELRLLRLLRQSRVFGCKQNSRNGRALVWCTSSLTCTLDY